MQITQEAQLMDEALNSPAIQQLVTRIQAAKQYYRPLNSRSLRGAVPAYDMDKVDAALAEYAAQAQEQYQALHETALTLSQYSESRAARVFARDVLVYLEAPRAKPPLSNFPHTPIDSNIELAEKWRAA